MNFPETERDVQQYGFDFEDNPQFSSTKQSQKSLKKLKTTKSLPKFQNELESQNVKYFTFCSEIVETPIVKFFATKFALNTYKDLPEQMIAEIWRTGCFGLTGRH